MLLFKDSKGNHRSYKVQLLIVQPSNLSLGLASVKSKKSFLKTSEKRKEGHGPKITEVFFLIVVEK